jgi:NAD(P)-dependent dehydrogenase (short-subunit alcohol dehydrogenase family)
MRYQDKTVVITGAGSGIGRGLAAGFCADGANVVGFGRTAAALEATAREIGRGKMHVVVGDLGREEDITRLFAEARSRFGRIDVLVNNAALYPRHLFLEGPADELERVLEVNVLGMARCCRAVLPDMLARGHGRILNLGSFAWRGPIPTASAYSISKAAVHVLTKSIAVEIDRARYPDVLVNELVPGIVKSGMSPEGLEPAEVYPFARAIVDLPAGGPHGELFLKGELHRERPSWKRRLLARLGLR